MKTGRTLQEIAAELERQVSTRKDFIAPQSKIEAVVDDSAVKLTGLNGGDALAITPYAHGQISDYLGIPKKYYDRMTTEQPELLARNVNTWLKADGGNKRMIRTLDGRVRAFLSPKFRPLDNYDLMEAVLPTLQEKGVQVMSAELTETRLYIKCILPTLSDAEFLEALATGEHLYGQGLMKDSRLVAAMVISNSDIGAGTLRLEPSVFTTRCTNLAILLEAAMKKYHTGRAFTADESYEVFRDETRRQDDKAFWMKVRDITGAAFDSKIFTAAIASIRTSQSKHLKSEDLPAVVEAAVQQLALPERATNGILKFLAGGGDLTAWGLSSAITATANTWDDYEEATQLERAGGKVIDLGPADWKVITEAA